MKEYILELDVFVRKIGLSKNSAHAFFLGAGASVSSGVPSADSCIWEWKRNIFLSNHPGLEPQFSELTLSAVRQKIQRWLDSQNRYPKIGNPEEYSFYVNECYKLVNDRRKYFEQKIKGAKPHIGYKLLCLLAETGFSQTVFTTNFDGLVTPASSEFDIVPIEIGIDSQHRLTRQLDTSELMTISLHGDYRYDKLKNTITEIQEQEKILREHLIKTVKDTPLIVSGYSGRDQSIMEAFLEAYSQEGTGALYWCGYGDEIPPSVVTLLETANKNNRTAHFIPTNGFDDLMKRLSLYCLTGIFAENARKIVSQLVNNIPERSSFFISDKLAIQTLVKSNAFEIECPTNLLQFDIKNWPSHGLWKWLRQLSEDKNFVAVPYRKKILALGNFEDITSSFKDNLIEPIERTPVDQKELIFEDGAINSLFRQGLVRAIAKNTNLHTDGRDQIWQRNVHKRHKEGEFNCIVYESALLFLRKIGEKIYLIIKPSLRVENSNPNGKELPIEIVNKVKNSILGYQHNKEFNQAVNLWRNLILGNKGSVKIIKFGDNSNSDFVFKIRRTPVFSVVRSQKQTKSIAIDSKLQVHIRQNGIQLGEPKLVFSTKQGNNFVYDEHPLRGLIQNRPYDFSITQSGILSKVTIGVICPKNEDGLFQTYLHKAQLQHSPSIAEQDYLINFPGFSSAFGLPLEIPRPGDYGWSNCAEPAGTDIQKTSLELSRILVQTINDLKSSINPSVIIIFIPSRWKHLRGFETDNEEFDLHDFVKAYCAQHGISTQFLEQETLTDPYQCRIWWWLSLALYTKSMRTPWVLEALDLDTAFVGLGFSINKKAERGRHVVLGCSHLYNARGEGLQFRLSPIENPTIFRKNAFMSREDARNVGETIRTLFFESSFKLPKRVVIHKQTAFRKDEREGLLEGLSDVQTIDMLEINFDSALRYVASIQKQNGFFDEDNFPVRRGTTIQLDSHSALVWLHGVTDAVKPGWRYYKGKRRIPTPLVIRRYAGHSDISQIASEILALSKMDWNSADMYSKLPATIQSSHKVAKIGSLLHRFNPIPFDYRLFI